MTLTDPNDPNGSKQLKMLSASFLSCRGFLVRYGIRETEGYQKHDSESRQYQQNANQMNQELLKLGCFFFASYTIRLFE